MSTTILPDGSIVVRLASHTVHLDVRTRAIHLRATTSRDELGGSILESFPQTAIDRVRLVRAPDGVHHLLLELRSGRELSLGRHGAYEMAMTTARAVSDLTRCRLEISQGSSALPLASDAFSAAVTYSDDLRLVLPTPGPTDPFEAPTGRFASSPPPPDEAATVPPPPPGAEPVHEPPTVLELDVLGGPTLADARLPIHEGDEPQDP